MKKTGRLLLAGAMIVALAVRLPAALLETEIDDGAIEVGESTTLRVKLTGDPSDIRPTKYPFVAGLKIEYSGMQRSIQIINGKTWSGAELIFTVTALKQGKFRIPGFVFSRGKDTLQSREVTLSASAGRSGSTGAIMDMKPFVSMSATSLYVGQPVVMRYYLLSSGIKATLRGFDQIPNTKGFVIKKIDESDGDGQQGNDLNYEKTHIATFALIPAEPGNYRVGGGRAVFSVDARIRRPREEDFFNFNFPAFTQTQALEFETRPLKILPLPRQGMPDDYRGTIGAFTIKADYADDAIKVFEEKKITVTVEGRGNLITMTGPVLEKAADGVKVIAEDGESSIKISGKELVGSRKFIYTLIPEKPGACEHGGFKLTFFNPLAGDYQTIYTKKISFVAKGDARKSDSGFDKEPEHRLDFNPLYFLLIAFTLAGIIVFVIIWERKRYRIVADDKDGSVDEHEDRTGADERDFRSDLAGCAESGDSDYFLKAAEKSIDRFVKNFSGPVPSDVETAINRIKGEIYQCKFGGGKIEHRDLKRLYDEITALIGR